MSFKTTKSQTISIGATAVNVVLANSPTTKGVDVAFRRLNSHVRIKNTHATQILYWKRTSNNAAPVTITTSNADGAIGPLDFAVIDAPNNDRPLQMIASGATTTGVVELGGETA